MDPKVLKIRFNKVSVTCFTGLILASPPSIAATVVKALLQDATTDAAIQSMRILVDHDTVPPGRITFRAENQSKDQIHELIVVRLDSGQMTLPYDEKKYEVIETRIHRMGEIPDLKPGTSGAMTLNLRPGSYLLICNQPGHYKAGMTAKLVVSK